MRVAHVLEGPMNLGGVESFIMNMFSAIDKDRFVFDFVCKTEEKGFWDDKIEALGGKIYRINYNENKLNNYVFKAGARAYRRFFRAHPEFDAVHIHSYSCARFYIADAARKAGIKFIVYHLHSTDCGSKLLNSWGRRRLLRGGIKTIACGQAASLWGYGTVKDIIHNAIDYEAYEFSEETRANLRHELGVGDNVKVIGTVGRVSAEKNHGFLLDIAKNLSPKCLIMIVGDGGLLEKLQHRIKEENITNVILLGGRTDTGKLLNVFDLFVLPSLHEGLPVTAIEAQANGLRCVFSDRVSDEADITKSNLFIDLSNVKAWTDALNTADGKRENNFEALKTGGYVLASEVKQLERLYKEGARSDT